MLWYVLQKLKVFILEANRMNDVRQVFTHVMYNFFDNVNFIPIRWTHDQDYHTTCIQKYVHFFLLAIGIQKNEI